ncbi:erythrocyte membrane protein 1, PfEMP1, putative [Plasmodium sp.]|nr:erythrocyte membrane protein 1, PfEMP1, putative [Plasmodium sp.]
MAATSSGGGDANKSAKDVLDEIGGIIQQEAKTDAKNYTTELQGNLKEAKFPHGKSFESPKQNACLFDHTKDTNVTVGQGKEDPCLGTQTVRFSDTNEAQCYFYEIKGNNSTIGFCAPYRRLHLCVQNLEQIDPVKINSAHNLLVDVLLAAKHEGETLVKKYKEYKKTNKDLNTNICTILARSFADIGDIIRGKDLYLAHEAGKQHLEKRLQRMFENIKNKNQALKSLTNEQVREYWWALNRNQVWRAITCDAPKEANYFVHKPGNYSNFSDHKCGHEEGTVLTNLDYVPQFLRWFEEWSENFCRKRNNSLKLAKEACRNDKERKYCSHNGYDCMKRIEKGKSCSKESKCTDCLNKCIPYEHWLEKEQNEFNMQKDKYENEIKTYVNNKGISYDNINTEYYETFYENFGKKEYATYDKFLMLLNNGKYCKAGVEGEYVIDFNKNGNKDAFDRSEYCQPCPDCVVECNGEKCEENENGDNCRSKIIEDILRDEEPTQIDVLYSGKGEGLITEKLKDFCTEPNKYNGENDQKWQCYNKNREYNKCEMISSLYKDPKEYNLMLSIQCFYSWAQNLLIDIIRWEHQLKDCINNTNVTDCKSNCNKNCKCYEEWIKRKGHEWKKVKEVFENQDKNTHNYYDKLKDVFDRFLFQVQEALKGKEHEKWKQFKEDLNKKFESSEAKTPTGNSKDAIEFLLDHLNDNAITCIDNNSLVDENCPITKDNPCIKNRNNNKPTKTVKHIAETMQRRARKQLEKHGGEIILKGDASQGKYRNHGNPKDFENVCKITENHSNCTYKFSKEPCGGKDSNETMFDINEGWKRGSKIDMTDEETYMPPRRQHFCTSNLEFLETGEDPFSNNNSKLINDSFLGDVLLSAKFEADFVKRKYEGKKALEGFKDEATICQAIRYSFADIGDIIRGRDIWDKDESTKNMESHLIPIFEKIKKYHPDIKDNQKYNGDENNKPPYKKLREDWWEANRHQVWRAMKCAIENGNINNCNGIPIEDYIPQRLRWMTELAEWYGKFESKVNKECGGCWDNGNRADKKCKGDQKKCDVYNTKMRPWKGQWKKLGTKYSTLYGTAKVNAFKDNTDKSKVKVKEKDEPVYDFLLDLYLENGGKVDPSSSTDRKRLKLATTDTNTPYNNAGAYVHDMVDLTGSMDEKEFCNRGMTFKLPKDDPSIDSTPSDDDETDTAPEDGKTEKDDKEVCGIVNEVLNGEDGTKKIQECNIKNYNGWKCNSDQFQPDHAGACMPPRREKLCVYFFAGKKVIDTINTQEDLRKAFIKSAAAETFLSWHKYKSDNKGGQLLQSQLEGGTIPEDFKRQMFYTYGDYRDFVFGTDISKNHGKTSALGKKIENLFPENGRSKNSGDVSRQIWWDRNGPQIWKAMLCALSYDTIKKQFKDDVHKNLIDPQNNNTYPNVKFSGGNNPPTLEEFAQRPQFLRWFTEWSDEFCRERKKKLDELVKECKFYECNNGDNGVEKKKCEKACEDYKNWLQKWKDDYDKQSKKYFLNKEEYEKNPSVRDDVKPSTHAYEYLKKVLPKNCTGESCSSCMDAESSETSKKPENDTHDAHMPKSLDEEPEEVQGKCNCPVSPLPPPAQPKETEENCTPADEKVEEEPEEPAEKPAEEPAQSEQEPEDTPVLKPEEEAPVPEKPTKEDKKVAPRPPPRSRRPRRKTPKNLEEHPAVIPSLATSTLMWTVGIGFAAFTYFFLKKKTKASVGNLFQILQIPKSDYDIPTLKSSNRYIPYVSDRHKGKTYIYMEGDSSGDEKYAFMSDTTDITSSESEYEELDINDIYVPGSPKYKTLIEVVLEPSKRDIQSDDIPSSDIPTNKFTDEEWNQLKHDFISNMLQNQPKDVPNDYKSENVILNTQPNTLYFDKPQEKPFITSIHDRNLYSGEEYNYNVNMVNNDDIPINRDNNVYSGIDLINDSLNSNNVDIYDEVLKRKENELFGTNHPKHTNTHNVTKSSNSDPIDNQLNLFHTWLDRHKDMCEQWNNKEDVLDKLKEEWNKDKNSGDIPSDSNKTLNTDVSIQIHMDNPKPTNEFTNMDTILEDLEKYNDPYYDVQDDIYYDVNDHDTSTVDSNNMDVPSKVQIEMDVNTKLVKEKYPIADVWDI